MIELTFLGGAQTVTGSKHLVRTARATVLLECGLFALGQLRARGAVPAIPIYVDSPLATKITGVPAGARRAAGASGARRGARGT